MSINYYRKVSIVLVCKLQELWPLFYFVKFSLLVKLPLSSVEFVENFIAVSFSVLKRQYFCFLLSIKAFPGCVTLILCLWASLNTQQHSLIPVRCEYTTANLLEYTIWNLCQLVFLCVFYVVCRMLSSTKLSGNKLTGSFFWSRAEKWVYSISVICTLRLWTFWFWDYEPSNRFVRWKPQLSHQLAWFFFFFCLQ